MYVAIKKMILNLADVTYGYCNAEGYKSPSYRTHSQVPAASGVIIDVKKVAGNNSRVSTFLSSNLTLLPCQCAV